MFAGNSIEQILRQFIFNLFVPVAYQAASQLILANKITQFTNTFFFFCISLCFVFDKQCSRTSQMKQFHLIVFLHACHHILADATAIIFLCMSRSSDTD